LIFLFFDASLYKSSKSNLQAINCQEIFSSDTKSIEDFIIILVISEVFIHSTIYFLRESSKSSNLHFLASQKDTLLYVFLIFSVLKGSFFQSLLVILRVLLSNFFSTFSFFASLSLVFSDL